VRVAAQLDVRWHLAVGSNKGAASAFAHLRHVAQISDSFTLGGETAYFFCQQLLSAA